MSIKNIWQELFLYWKENEDFFNGCMGATTKELNILKSSIQLDLPKNLEHSLKCCNSYPKDLSKVKKSSCLFLGNGIKLYNINTIIEIYQENIEYDLFENRNIIPILDWNGDIYVYINTRNQKIYYHDLEFNFKKIIFNSYQEFLMYVKSNILKKGEFTFDDLQQCKAL